MLTKGNTISKIGRFSLSFKIIIYMLFVTSLLSFILISGFFFLLLALSVWTEKEKVQ